MDANSHAELRRQKILANAEARLRKIKRIAFDDLEREPEEQESIHSQRLVNEPEVGEKYSSQSTDSKNPEEVANEKNEINVTPFMSDPVTKQSKPFSNGNVCNGLNDSCDHETPCVEYIAQRNNSEVKLGSDSQLFENGRSTFAFSQKTKRVYSDLAVFMFLGILVRFVCLIGLSSIFLNNILGPFLVVCLPRIVVYIKQKPELSIIYTLMLFMGIQENRVKMPLRVLYCLRTAVQYLALYLFSFFLTHCIIKELYSK